MERILVNTPPRPKYTISSIFPDLAVYTFHNRNMVNLAWLGLCDQCFLFSGVTNIFCESSVLSISHAQCPVQWPVVCRTLPHPFFNGHISASLQPSGKVRRPFLRHGEAGFRWISWEMILSLNGIWPSMSSHFPVFLNSITRVRSRLLESLPNATFTHWTRWGVPPATDTILFP